MNSKKKSGKPTNVSSSSSSSSGRGNLPNAFTPLADQLARGVADVSLHSAEDGDWVVSGRKLNDDRKSGSSTWAQESANPKPWAHPDVVSKLGMRNNDASWKASGSTYKAQTSEPKEIGMAGRSSKPQGAGISAPLEGGWNWHSRAGAGEVNQPNEDNIDDDDFDSNAVDESDDADDDDYSDGFESDETQESHNTKKMSKWFKTFFEALGKLTVSEISEPTRQWHCPACHGGPGAIDWYRGLEPLLRHANTKGSQRVKLHREFANILSEELRIIGASVIPSEFFGRWNGLETQVRDFTIVWPPTVIIMNTHHERDDNDKWTGMGNQELLDYFSTYDVMKAKHSYGPQGHRGMGLLIFEASGIGYLEAERLHKHFETQQKDRHAWEHHRSLFYPAGKRQLYGFLASKEDMECFNQHTRGKQKIKYELKSYQEMVVKQIKEMKEDNQQITMYKDRANRLEMKDKVKGKSLKVVSEKLRKIEKERHIMRQRTKTYHEQSMEEMDSQDKFFKDQLAEIQRSRDANDEEFEKLKQQEREKARVEKEKEEAENFINFQEEGIMDYERERDKLMKVQEQKMVELKRKHVEELLQFENNFSAQLSQLRIKYS